MQICRKCQQEKDTDQFNQKYVKSKKHGQKLYTEKICKTCHNERVKKQYKENPDITRKRNERAKQQYNKDKKSHIQKSKEWARKTQKEEGR